MDQAATNPATLYLRKGEERRLLAGHDWIYSNEIDTARSPLKGFEPGQSVEVVSQRGRWLAHAYINPHSLIAARVLSRDNKQPFDRDELARRLRGAAALRDSLYGSDCYRWVFGESDRLPGLVVDRYGRYAVVQLNTAGMERWRDDIVSLLAEIGGLEGVLLRSEGDLRSLENLPALGFEVAFGQVPDEVQIEENGVRFLVPLKTGQKTGWFYDQADNRRRGRGLLGQGTVIDGFSYAGGWGVTAALAGASKVICIDSSEPALACARQNAALNGVESRMEFVRADVGEALQGLGRSDRPTAIVLDPPAFAKRKKDVGAAAAGYQRLNELALGVLRDDGFLVSCSCSQHIDRDQFLRIAQKAGRRAGRDLQLLFEGGQSADHPIHPAMPETRYLKALFLRAGMTGE